MEKDFFLVHKSILPEGLDKIIECRNLVEHENLSVSDACKKVGVSRTKYYKYKDLVFYPNQSKNQTAILTMRLKDEKGLLSKTLNEISSVNGNVITINQDTPVSGIAYISLAIDIKDMSISINELINKLSALKGVNLVKLLAIE